MHPRFAAALCAVAVAAALVTGAARAHEGHDHADAPPAAPAVASPRGEAATDALELVAVVQDTTLTAYLDRFASNEPVTGATITVEGPSGPVTLTGAPDGRYTASAPWLAQPGAQDLLFTVTVEGGAEILPVTVTVPGPAAATTLAPTGMAPALGDGLARPSLLLAVAALAFLLGVAVTILVRRRRPLAALAVLACGAVLAFGGSAWAHEGEDHNEARAPGVATRTNIASAQGDLAQRLPDGTVFVPKPTQRILAIRTAMSASATYRRTIELPGRIIPDPNASGVVQSSVGGRLSAPSTGFPKLGTLVKKGDILAYVTPPVQRIDVSDMRQRQGELDQQIAIVQRRVERYQKLAHSGAEAQVQLDEAIAELKGLRYRRAAIDAARSEPEALVAPAAGVIAESTAVAGQMATPGVAIFQVVDPGRLWVEALSFESLSGAQKATARLADGRTVQLAYQGSGFADRNQSVPIHFAVQGATAGLRVGQFVTVLAETDEESSGIALPRASVVRAGNGQDIVYEHSTAERFTAHPVRVLPLDADRILIPAGLPPGKRVVTQGAELLDQVR